MDKVWPFEPTTRSFEQLSWRTDVRRTYASEMRESLRVGRQRLSLQHILPDSASTALSALFRQNLFGNYWVPVWFEAHRYAPALAVGTSSFAVAGGDYRVGERAFLYSPDGQYQLVTVSSVGAATFTTTPGASLPVGLVAPGRLCYPVGAAMGGRLATNVRERQVVFESRSNVDLASHDLPELDGVPILEDVQVLQGSVADNLIHVREYIDNGLGPVAVVPQRDFAEALAEVRHIDEGLPARMRRKRWLHYLRGRENSFWLPSQGFDLNVPVVGAVDSYVDAVAQLGEPPEALALRIEDAQGPVYRTVASISILGPVWRYAITSPVGRGMASPRVSMMRRMRSDADEIQIDYRSENVAEVVYPVREVLE